MKKSLLAMAVTASLLPYASLSQAQQATAETVVVTANRFEQTATSVLASVSVIEREEIEASQATTALELLKSLPGIYVNSQGNKGNANSIYIRGTYNKHALVIVDGVRLNSATSGGAAIGLIPAFAIEKIEVVRGPRAAVYGSDAVGGVISITTVPASGSVKEIKLGLGTDRQDQQGLRVVDSIGENTRGSFVANHEQSDGYRIYDLAADDDTHGYDSYSLFGSVNHTLASNWELYFSGYGRTSEVEYADQFGPTKKVTDEDLYGLSAGVVYSSDPLRSELQVNSSKDRSGTGNVEGDTSQAVIESKRKAVSWVNTYYGLEHTVFNFGLDYYQEEAGRGGTNTTDYGKTDKDNKAAFVTTHIDFAPVIAEFSVRRDDDSAFGGETTWNAALGFDVTDEVRLSGSHGTAFKAPTFNDLYWPASPFSEGNPNLLPETSKSSEVSVLGYHQWFDWGITGYQTKIKNFIDWAENPSVNKWTPSNVANAKIRGLELTLGFSLFNIDHALAGEWVDAIDEGTQKDLIRTPQEKFSWNMTYIEGNFDANLSTIYVGRRTDKNGDEMEGYTTADVGLGYKATDAIKFGIRVNNLFDKGYVTAKGSGSAYYLGEGRTVFVTGSYLF